jgi:alpha-galactosidase
VKTLTHELLIALRYKATSILVCTIFLLLIFSLGRDLAGHCEMKATLNTQQTTILVEAGMHSPRLVMLKDGTTNTWANKAKETLIGSVWMNGKLVPLHWNLNRAACQSSAEQIIFVYDSAAPRMRLTWEWQARASTGPIEHRVHIQNLGSQEMWIPLQDSFRFDWSVDPATSLQQVYVDKGAGKPTAVGTHQVTLPASYRWEGRSSTYARDNDAPEIIPWTMVERTESKDGWYVGIEFSGRTRLILSRDRTSLHGRVGLDPEPSPFRTLLQPGHSFDAPVIFVGAFTGGPDGLGNVLRPWVRHVLMNPKTWGNPNYPLMVNNSWGSGMQVNEVLAKRMIRDSADLGFDMFHLDAGWFRGVGDWYPDKKKFPQGLSAIADYAHQHGLKFGIWANWAEAGIDTNPGAVNARDPRFEDWLIADVPPGWRPDEFVGRTMDLGDPAVHSYAQHEVERIVKDYKLDMLEHDGYVVAKGCLRIDHPHASEEPPLLASVKGRGIDIPDNANSTDVSYHATQAYYDIYTRLRKANPNLLLEICNDGGRMVDFGSAAHGDYFSITDSYDPLSNRQAFYDASHVLPPAMLEDYVQRWPTPTIDNFRYMLRSGMMGWLTIMQDTNAWTEEQHRVAKEEFSTYKRDLRPLIRDANLYHISERPDGIHWDGIEYFDRHTEHGVVYAFRGSGLGEASHIFQIDGLSPNKNYRLSFHDQTSKDFVVSGRELMSSGLTVHLPLTNSSELIFLNIVGN